MAQSQAATTLRLHSHAKVPHRAARQETMEVHGRLEELGLEVAHVIYAHISSAGTVTQVYNAVFLWD